MQKAYLNLIKYALTNNATVSVWNGEEWSTKRGTSYNAIKDDIESVEECTLRFRDAETKDLLGSAYIVLDGEPDEMVADHSDTELLNTWWDLYHNKNN